MKFTLHATSYDWVFLPIAGSTFTDSGTRVGARRAAASTGIVLRAAASAGNAATNSLVLPRPTGTLTGDVLVARSAVRGTPTITTPVGWSLVRTDVRSTTFTQAVYIHVAGGAEPASYTFSFSANATAVGSVASYIGVDTVNPIAAHSGQSNASSTSLTAPSATTSVPSRLLGFFGVTGANSVTPPAGMTERTEAATATGVASKLTIELADQNNPGIGATGTRIATASAAGTSIGQLVALRPSSAGPPPNTVPTADAASGTTPQDTALSVGLAGHDPETCELAFSIVAGPSHGALGAIGALGCTAGSPNSDGATVLYTPTAGYHGPDSFTYRVSDGTDFSAAATVSITVSTVANNVPSADAVSLATARDTASSVTLTGHDLETCELTFSIVGAPSHGALGAIGAVACAAGSPNSDTASVLYTPNAGYTGPDAFTYRVSDGTDFSAAATVSVTVSAPGTGITFRGVASGTNASTTSLLVSRPAATLAGDVLLAAVTVRGTPTISAPAGWSLVRSDARATTFTQAVFVHLAGGAEPASYTWSFSLAATAVGTIAAYSGVDTANPVVAHAGQANNSATAMTAPSLTLALPNTWLVGFYGIVGKITISPPAGMTERVEIVSPTGVSSKLTATLDDQSNPASGATGTRVATAASAAHNIGQLIALRPGAGGPPPPNNPPLATADSYATSQDTPLVQGAPGVLGNDTDPDGDSLSAILTSTVSHGSLTLNVNGSFSYTPNAGYTGPDAFSYHANDGSADSSSVTVSLTVNPTGSGGITFRGVASGTNASTTSLLVSRPAATLAGDVLLAAVTVRGTPTISAPAGWSLVRSDARATTFTQAVFVHLAGGAEPASYTWSFSLAATAVGTIAAYSGVDTANPVVAHAGQANNSATAMTAPSLTLALPNTWLVGFYGIVGKITISPPAGMTERVEIVSPTGVSSKLTATLDDQSNPASGATGTRVATAASAAHNIGQLIALRPGAGGPPPPNNPPLATADSYATSQDTPLVQGAPGVLGNDTDPDGDSLSAILTSTVSHGSLTLNVNGSFSYTPNAGYTGPDAFSYHANDGSADSSSVTVSLTVNPTGSGGITFRGVASGTNASTTSLLVSRPAATLAGDVLLAAVTVRGTPTISAPAGWSLVRSDARATTFTQAVFVHLAGGAEPASYTWSFSLAATAVGTIAAYSGVDTANPVVAHAGQANNSATAMTAPSLTLALPNTWLVGFYGIVGKITISPPAGMTERVEIVSPTGVSSKLTATLDDQSNPASGATGTRVATAASAAHNIGQLIALRPAP